MGTNKKLLNAIFKKLNERILELNHERKQDGACPIKPCEVTLLGQMSLMANERSALILALAQTGDMDAHLQIENAAKEELKKILTEHGLTYDEDSYLIWIPPCSSFSELFRFSHVVLKSIDPESALVSKAIKAPKKNKQLIQDALASGEFRGLVDRILANGGSLENFL